MRPQDDESRRLRIRDAALTDGLGRLERDPALGMPCLLAQTRKLAKYPAAAQSFFACAPLTLLGAEVEGGPGATLAGSATFFALNLGTAIPPIGTSVLVTSVESRWVFRFDG